MGGGGAKSALWRQIHADILGLSVVTAKTPENSATGAAMLAGIGTEVFPSFEEACEKTVRHGDEIRPDNTYRAGYEQLYHRYRALYPALQEHFRQGA
jgi:xylulokinase